MIESLMKFLEWETLDEKLKFTLLTGNTLPFVVLVFYLMHKANFKLSYGMLLEQLQGRNGIIFICD